MKTRRLVRLAVAVLFVGVAGVAGAQGEVHNPWSRSGPPTNTAPAPRPAAAGDRVALLPTPALHPAWAFSEVLNPWADDQPDRSFRRSERPLIERARAGAEQLAACFPESHFLYRYWVPIRFGRTPVTQGTQPEIDRCVGRVVSRWSRSGDYTLVLRFDPEGLRETFVLESSRIPSSGSPPPREADAPEVTLHDPFN